MGKLKKMLGKGFSGKIFRGICPGKCSAGEECPDPHPGLQVSAFSGNDLFHPG